MNTLAAFSKDGELLPQRWDSGCDCAMENVVVALRLIATHLYIHRASQLSLEWILLGSVALQTLQGE
jgi:hypothetical protein